MPRTEQDVLRVWNANEYLLNAHIHPDVIAPLARPPGLSTEDPWHYVLATSFARCHDTLRAVQILGDPERPQRLWVDAFVLSRSIFEADITLRWCAKEPENRRRFLDDYRLHVARMFDSLPIGTQAEVTPERQQQIRNQEAEVIERYSRGPGTRSIMPRIEEMCRSLSQDQPVPNAHWEYENYYRDVSAHTHLTAWHLFSYRARGSPITEVKGTPDHGFRALLVSAGSFLRVLQQWNGVFNRLAANLPLTWLSEWEARIR